MTAQRVAVLSDVHGVLPILAAVLAEPDVAGADLVVVTGDHVAGPQPVETLDLLSSLGDRVRLVRGNADREVVDLARGRAPSQIWQSAVWAAEQLRPDQIDLLDSLPHPVTVRVAGFGPVVFCHGTPRNDEEVVLVDTRISRWLEVFEELDDDVRTVVGGHTHMPFVRLVDRRLVVNPGSLGMPYGRAGGTWALLDRGAVSIRSTPVDVEAVAAAVVGASGFPDVEEWVQTYVRDPVSDVEALRVFGPRDGRPG